ncbi:MAG: cytosolic protein [Proteobacteria bacterium]|nr:cytosolic protein [Pseudomonadota bacterium]
MECKKKENLTHCNCSYDPCARKGTCCDCVSYHRKSRQLPACFFSNDAEKTYDRSYDHFARLVSQKKI